MKYRVVGWISYDDPRIEDAPITEAARNAIIDEIRRCNYDFTGWHHQEALYGAPVLNDGMRRCFSQRGFGAVMAEAHGETGLFAYSSYAFDFGMGEIDYNLPNDPFDPEDFIPEPQLNEEFVLPYTEELRLEEATGILRLPDLDQLRYIDTGDTLRIVKEETSALFTVREVIRTPDIEEKELKDLMGIAHLSIGPEAENARTRLESAPTCLILSIEPNR